MVRQMKVIVRKNDLLKGTDWKRSLYYSGDVTTTRLVEDMSLGRFATERMWSERRKMYKILWLKFGLPPSENVLPNKAVDLIEEEISGNGSTEEKEVAWMNLSFQLEPE